MDEKRMKMYRENSTDGAFVSQLDWMDDMLQELRNLDVRWNKDGNMDRFIESLDGNLKVLRIRTTLVIQKQLMAEGIVSKEDWRDMTLKFCLAAPGRMGVILDMENRLGLEHCMYLDDTIRSILTTTDEKYTEFHYKGNEDTIELEIVDDPEPEDD